MQQHMRGEHQRYADDHQQQLRREVGDREHDVQARRLSDADDVDNRQEDHHADPEHHVAGPVLERRGVEPAQVVGHEERGDRDRDRVVEHLRPCREERPELVEGVPRKARGTASLGEHRRRLGIRSGGEVEDPPCDQKYDRRQTERIRRDQPERVVDRGADVPVCGREQRACSKHPPEPVLRQPRHW